jgi:predicted acylesterase/phospholipase RssA
MATPREGSDIGRSHCDLVMKGGITSGVVFPAAVARLASTYRFRNIGGTSAGAIAAAGAAAAEYFRARTGSDGSFERLATLPKILSEKPGGKHSRLFEFFKPEPATRKHFRILSATLNKKGVKDRVVHGIVAATWNFKLAALLGWLPALLLLAGLDFGRWYWLVAATVCIATGIFLSAFFAVCAAIVSLLRALPGQAFGLSRGYRAEDNSTTWPPPEEPAPESRPPQALTNWLYEYFQLLAGKTLEQPLTFGDLSSATSAGGEERGVKLKMMTTALSMGRPFSLPLRRYDFYFAREELALYFPPNVIEWMVRNPGVRPTKTRGRDEKMKEFGYLPFPADDTLPVVVATRMSLSFPGLLSAVPLYRYAWEQGRSSQKRVVAETDGEKAGESQDAVPERHERFDRSQVERVVFSDGGICSNFPVHMFDSVLPSWPTFGINLRDDLREGDLRANLPPIRNSLPPEKYAIGSRDDGGTVTQFASAIVKTMQNWRDNLQRAAPGFRDRIVTISHTPEEGGLNLDMDETAIKALSDSGALGAQELIDGFATPPSPQEDYWTHHRWIRVRSLLGVLSGGLDEVYRGVTGSGNMPTYPDLLSHARAYVGNSYSLNQDETDAAHMTLESLAENHSRLAAAAIDFSAEAPRPAVELKILPVI